MNLWWAGREAKYDFSPASPSSAVTGLLLSKTPEPKLSESMEIVAKVKGHRSRAVLYCVLFTQALLLQNLLCSLLHGVWAFTSSKRILIESHGERWAHMDHHQSSVLWLNRPCQNYNFCGCVWRLRLRSGSAHSDLALAVEAARGRRSRRSRRSRRKRKALIKSNNPHLAGEESIVASYVFKTCISHRFFDCLFWQPPQIPGKPIPRLRLEAHA